MPRTRRPLVARPLGLCALVLAVLPVAACGGAVADSDPAAGAATADGAGVRELRITAVPEDSLWVLDTRSISGASVPLRKFQGKVALLVNVASECGLTPQYEGLQALQAELGGDDFTVLGFPSNDFGGQEPGTPEQILQFCEANYGIDFPMFEKVRTQAGEGQSPVYARLSEMTGELPSWNFSKYLIARDGRTATFFDPRTDPGDPELRAAIEAALAE